MVNPLLLNPVSHIGRFGQLAQMSQATNLRAATHCPGLRQGGSEPPGTAPHAPHKASDQPRAPLGKDIIGAPLFTDVTRIHQWHISWAHGDALDLDAVPFQRLYLAANKAVGRLRVGVEDVGNFHEDTRPFCARVAAGYP